MIIYTSIEPMGLYYLMFFLLIINFFISWFLKKKVIAVICLILLILPVYPYHHQVDMENVAGKTSNMYLQGSKLVFMSGESKGRVVQPNGLSSTVDRIELNEKQTELLKKDDSHIVYLKNCIMEINLYGLLKIRHPYNVLYLDDTTFKQYQYYCGGELENGKEVETQDSEMMTRSAGFEIALDGWMSEEEKLLDENGNLK